MTPIQDYEDGYEDRGDMDQATGLGRQPEYPLASQVGQTGQFKADGEWDESVDYHYIPLQGKVSAKADTAAVVLAGGQGERLGRPGGKQVLKLLGKPVLTWSLEIFDAMPEVGLIVLVCPEDRMEEYRQVAVEPFGFVTPVEYAPAGSLRQESSFNGVEVVPEDYEFILIHDGARPLVEPQVAEHVLSVVKGGVDADGAVIGHPCVDTLKVASGTSIIGTPDRSAFWNAQTPQVFHADVIRQAHASALADGFVGTDDSSLVERIGGNVQLVEGTRDNIKVTVPEDLKLVEAVLSSRVLSRGED